MTDHVYKTIADLKPAEPKTGLEIVEVFQNEKSRQMTVGELVAFDAYDCAVAVGPVLTTDNQCFIIQNKTTGEKITVTLPENMNPQRARTITIVVYGKANEIAWPETIFWNDGILPQLGENVTVIGLLWDGLNLHGTVGIGY